MRQELRKLVSQVLDSEVQDHSAYRDMTMPPGKAQSGCILTSHNLSLWPLGVSSNPHQGRGPAKIEP